MKQNETHYILVSLNYHEAKPDLLHTRLINPFTTWKDNVPQPLTPWMVYSPARHQPPSPTQKRSPQQLCCPTSTTAAPWDMFPCGCPTGTQQSREGGGGLTLITRLTTKLTHGACEVSVKPREQQLQEAVLQWDDTSSHSERANNGGHLPRGAGPRFGPEYSYYSKVWFDCQERLQKGAGRLQDSFCVNLTHKQLK